MRHPTLKSPRQRARPRVVSRQSSLKFRALRHPGTAPCRIAVGVIFAFLRTNSALLRAHGFLLCLETRWRWIRGQIFWPLNGLIGWAGGLLPRGRSCRPTCDRDGKSRCEVFFYGSGVSLLSLVRSLESRCRAACRQVLTCFASTDLWGTSLRLRLLQGCSAGCRGAPNRKFFGASSTNRKYHAPVRDDRDGAVFHA